jgi:RsiW-degrading membrane proteinase PrsW (M82 family)
MLLHRLRPRSLPGIVAVVLVASLLAGVLVRQLIERSRLPIERARELARAGLYADAEHLYLEIAQRGPAPLPTLIELLDNHRRLLVVSSRALLAAGASSAIDALAATSGERRIDALLDAPDLPLDVAVLARWWNKVTHGRANERDRDRIAAIADGDSPAPWSNHLLGREAQADDRDEDAAERFAHEATAFDDRREDASAACNQWIDDGNWKRLTRALEAPRFARQVSAEVRMREATARRDWRHAISWFFPSQFEGARVGVLLLALVSGLVWFAICAQIGLLWESWRVRLPMYLGAMVLGVASTYVTMAVAMAEHAYGFAEKGHAILDAIYFVVGVGLREELSKALLLLPLVPIVKRWGRRREALACGALVGLGFAAAENVGYFHMGLSTALARFLTANFLHVSTTGLIAVAIDDYVRGREAQPGDLSRTLMVVVAAHGLYDFFLSSQAVGAGSFMAMFVFVLLTRRFVDVLRHLPGREGPLLEWFGVGLAVVAGATFVYACTLVAPWQAAAALLEGMLGLAIVTYMFVHELRNI